MRPLLALCAFLSLCACTVPARIVDPRDQRELPFARLVDELAAADVVILGEIHDSPAVHQTHLRIVEALAAKRPVVVSLEMFERDVQDELSMYLAGAMTEHEFLAGARPWPYYRTDYRPLVEFAREHGLVVIAANAPRPLAAEVRKQGLEAAADSPFAAADVSVPMGDEYAAFEREMAGDAHGHTADPAAMRRYYEAQCLKDATMAESIVRALRSQREIASDAMVVHVVGKFHSDHRRGIVPRILQREPELRIAVVSAEATEHPADGNDLAADVADYVLLVPPAPERERAMPVKPAAAAPNAAPTQPGAPVHPPAAAGNLEPAPSPHANTGGRPALGFTPDYESEGGVGIADLRAGGPAEKAGLRAGDLIVSLGDTETPDMQSYVQALAGLQVGSKVKVTVLRQGKLETVTVEVGSR